MVSPHDPNQGLMGKGQRSCGTLLGLYPKSALRASCSQFSMNLHVLGT